MRWLTFLSNPLPRAITQKVDDQARIQILAHLPHTRVEPLESGPEAQPGFPALKLDLSATKIRQFTPGWLALSTQRITDPISRARISYQLGAGDGAVMAEILGQCPLSLLDEFLKPPTAAERGKQGQLVLSLGGEKERIDVATNLGKTVPLGKAGWKVTLDKSFALFGDNDPQAKPLLPGVEFTVSAPDGKQTKYRVFGRLTIFPGPLDDQGDFRHELPEGLPAAWFHPADLRYGQYGDRFGAPDLNMLLQFVQTPDKKLFFRSLMNQGEEFRLDQSGPAPAEGIDQRIWPGEAASFVIKEYLPHARPCEQRIVPEDVRPGMRRMDLRTALQCRLVLDKKDRQGTVKTFTKELWLVEGAKVNDSVQGELDGEPFRYPFRLEFQNKAIALGFELELTRAESIMDPGTEKPATFASFVKLYDSAAQINGEDRFITMNEPLDHRGYKVYQSNYELLGAEPETMKAVSFSGFTIGRDPGLWLKYFGTLLLGLGIATMFYMKAYFFKPRARKAAVAK